MEVKWCNVGCPWVMIVDDIDGLRSHGYRYDESLVVRAVIYGMLSDAGWEWESKTSL